MRVLVAFKDNLSDLADPVGRACVLVIEILLMVRVLFRRIILRMGIFPSVELEDYRRHGGRLKRHRHGSLHFPCGDNLTRRRAYRDVQLIPTIGARPAYLLADLQMVDPELVLITN